MKFGEFQKGELVELRLKPDASKSWYSVVFEEETEYHVSFRFLTEGATGITKLTKHDIEIRKARSEVKPT